MEKGKLIGQGNTAEIYDYSSDKILKLYRSAMPEFMCEYEFNVTQNISNILGISPKAYEIIHTEGRIGAIYEKIGGTSMLREILSKVWTIKKQARLLANYHCDIQKKVNFELPTVKEKLKRDINAVPEFSDQDRQILFDYLDMLPDGDVLCHFDFHPDNILVSKDSAKVIDWMTACVGDKAADVSRTSVMLKYAELPRQPKLIKMLVRCFQRTIYKSYIKEYLMISDLNLEDIEKWEIPIAAARLCEWVPEEEKKKLRGIVGNFIQNRT